MDLAVEAQLAGERADVQWWSSEKDEDSEFMESVANSLSAVLAALDVAYDESREVPRRRSEYEAAVRKEVARDPWGVEYGVEFGLEDSSAVVRFRSAGEDKRFGTADDFVAGRWTREIYATQRLAIVQSLKRSGRCAASLEDLRAILTADGIEIDRQRDPWGGAYQFEYDTRWRRPALIVRSVRGDGETVMSRIELPCPVPRQEEMRAALEDGEEFPPDGEQVRAVLAGTGIDPDRIVDAWGTPYRPDYQAHVAADGIRVYESAGERTRGAGVAVYHGAVTLRCAGRDRTFGTADDFDGAEFGGMFVPLSPAEEHGAGIVKGTVRFYEGDAVASGVHVVLRRLKEKAGEPWYEATTSAQGGFLLRGVKPGTYRMSLEGSKIGPAERSWIPVRDGRITVVNVMVGPPFTAHGGVVGGVPGGVAGGAISGLGIGDSGPTPRVREYFPETLLWEPEIQTDANGDAHLRFPMADSITNWRLVAVGSTLDGRMARAEADLLVFQEFFVDHNPPPVLTSGDLVEQPVQVRNYTPRQQSATVEMAPNAWSTVGEQRKQVELAANASATVRFAVRAGTAIEAGKQRVTVIGSDVSDAVEKPVRVHPDGRESAVTFGDLVMERARLTATVPANQIAGATRGELKIYPNLMASLRDAIQGMLARPAGCAEQTLSTGYSNLVALQFARSAGQKDAAFERVALRNIRLTRDALRGFVAAGGGVRYWSFGAPDVAVTAYAIAFLTDAAEFVEVDRNLVQSLAVWLGRQQGEDHLWKKPQQSALAAQALASLKRGNFAAPAMRLAPIREGLADSRDPYVVAMMALASVDAGEPAAARDELTRLAKMSREEQGSLYWESQGTPFGGWGRSSKVEATALAVNAMSAWRRSHREDTRFDATIRRALVYLLRNRDRYGAWYATQTTLRTMQALAAAGVGRGGGGKLTVTVNGAPMDALTIAKDALEPIRVDVSKLLRAGDNTVEISATAGMAAVPVLLTVDYWQPWSEVKPAVSAGLELQVKFDRTEARVGEPIHCEVAVRRAAGSGNGMMMAEIGLPPGVEVDRALLDETGRRLGVDHYDVLPDRLVLYLWPPSGAATFGFDVRPRFPMEAKSAASVLYDYYNPEARTESAPVRFRVD